MRVQYVALFLSSIAFACAVPNASFAATDITDDIVSDTEWGTSGNPYIVSSGLAIQSGATLTIEPGVIVQINSGGIDVLGRLLAVGTPDEPVLFTSDAIDWGGIEFSNQDAASSLNHVVIRYASTAIFDYYSKELSISNTKVEESDYGIDAYGSHLSLNNFSAENISRDAIDIYESDVTLKNVTLKNVKAGIGVYTNSKADIFNLFVDQSYYEALALYERSAMHVSSSTLTNGERDGVGIYGGSAVDMQDSVISGFLDGAGIANYDYWPTDPANSLSLTNNDIYDNAIGISMYSRYSSYVISNNSIHDNILYGFELYGPATVDVSHNFWGNLSGPYSNPDNLSGKGDEIVYASGSTITFSPWLSYWGTPPISNVLFLPGIEGSRLYRPNYSGGTDKLWEPNTDGDVRDLYMNTDGTSVRFDVYTKERDVIDELPSGANVYKSFIAKMNDLETSGTINDWEPIAYDWRLSLDDILNYGNDVNGRIYYSGDLRATSTPYIIQELKHLATTSQTGKVTIIAHSNGGLLAKRLAELLGPTESARLIDKMIFVAVPQAGTPMAIPAGLHGYEQDHILGLVTSESTARTFAQNSPMEYQLLPSANYFTYVDDPVVTFDASLTDWITRYGATIHSQSSLHQFLTDSYGRVDPQTGDINQPIQFNSPLLSNAETLHTGLDNWTAPSGIELIQIAGWGAPKTVESTLYKKKGTGVTPEAIFTVDGDGTVVVPSALWTSTTTGAVNYWVNLRNYNANHPFLSAFDSTTFNHSRILEPAELLSFLSDQITNTTKPISDYIYLSTEAPVASNKRLRYALHSPLTLNLYDDYGRHTGISTSTGQVEEQIPGTYYTEFGDVKYLFSDASTIAHIVMNGYDTGVFTFNINQYTGDTLTASTTFKDIPTTASTTASLSILSDISTLSPMHIDENGDGKNIITIVPKLGETVSYEPLGDPDPVEGLAPTPEPVISSTRSGGRNRAVSISTIVSTPTRPLDTSVAITTEPVQVKNLPTSLGVQKKSPALISVTPPKKTNMNISQTASVYNASQQPILTQLGRAVYNGLHGFWLALKKFF